VFHPFLIFFLEAIPAIRFNLLLFKEKSKRISTAIRARAYRHTVSKTV